MNVIIAGSRAIPSGQVGRAIVALLGQLPPGAVVMLRHGHYTEPGTFEKMVSMVCDLMGVRVEWHAVELTDDVTGRQAVFARDLAMAADCDVAFCFTLAEQAYDMDCGTTALAQKVLEADKAVYHYAFDYGRVDENWSLIRVGEHDPGWKYERLARTLT